MQHGPNLFFFLILGVLLCALSAGVYWLLRRWHAFYKQPAVSALYMTGAAAVLAAMPFVRYCRPSEDGWPIELYLLYAGYGWVLGLILVAVLLMAFLLLRAGLGYGERKGSELSCFALQVDKKSFAAGAVVWIVLAILAELLLVWTDQPVGKATLLIEILAGLAVIWLVAALAAFLLWSGYSRLFRNSSQQADASDLAAPTGSLSRRSFLRGAAASVPAAAWSFSTAGVIAGDKQLVCNRHTLLFPNLPAQLEGMRIAQISDLHIGPFVGMNKLERVLHILEQQQPDMLVITGDLIDNLDQLDATMERLNRYVPTLPRGGYFCWGNHEYFRDINRIRRKWEDSPVTVLRNQAVRLLDGERPVYIAGVDFPWAKRGEERVLRENMLAETLREVPSQAFTILLTHHPDFFAESFRAGVDLSLGGHTHGGQIALFGKCLLPLTYPYLRGFYQKSGSVGYVHVGTGHWWPCRIGCPAEIAVFTLRQRNGEGPPQIQAFQ